MNLNYLSPEHLYQKKLPLPDTDTIDICIYPIDDIASLADSIPLLSTQEKKKAASFRQGNDRLRFITSRILLRRILSLYLDYPAEELLFRTGVHGKPYLYPDKNDFTEIHFNLSHSGKFVALAFSLTSPVGIDIEEVRTNVHSETLIRRFFYPNEYSEFLKLDSSEKQDFLFRRWTVREAFLKGIGQGFSMSPDSFYVQESSSVFLIKKSQKDYSSWRVEPVSVPDGYYCSIAYQSYESTVY